MRNFSLVIVTRPTELENLWISEFLHSFACNIPVVIVGNLIWGENLDGQICRKKNIGVAQVGTEFCLVCHADAYPVEYFHQVLQLINIAEGEVLCPLGLLQDGRQGLTWAQTGHDYPSPKYVPGESYISGAAIFGRTSLFRRIQWNEELRWGQGEDIDFSRRLEKAGITQRFETRLIVNMRRSQ